MVQPQGARGHEAVPPLGSTVRGPLAGVRILDLTRVVMGPFATQILADQGAEVIIVEAVEGDTSRVMGPGPHDQFSGISLNLLRNKRSIVIDLKTAQGRDIALRLAATCDVVVTTMRPGALARLGVDYESVREVRPDIVYCQAQGFPLDSPHADDPAYDDIIQVATGVADIMERAFGEPLLIPSIITDKLAGLVIAQAVTASLLHRDRTGEGEHIEVPMQQAASSFMLAEHGSGAISEPPSTQDDRPAAGYPRVLSRERRPHPTKDGWVHLLPYLPKHYALIFSEAGVPGAYEDSRYVDRRAALRHSDSLYSDVRAIAPSRTTEEWLTYCRQVGIPATPVVSLQDMIDDLPRATHPVAGEYRVIPMMARFKRLGSVLRRHAPLIGEDTDGVLAELVDLETTAAEHGT